MAVTAVSRAGSTCISAAPVLAAGSGFWAAGSQARTGVSRQARKRVSWAASTTYWLCQLSVLGGKALCCSKQARRGVSWAASKPILAAPVSTMGPALQQTGKGEDSAAGASVGNEQESQLWAGRGLVSFSRQVRSKSVGREQPEAAAAWWSIRRRGLLCWTRQGRQRATSRNVWAAAGRADQGICLRINWTKQPGALFMISICPGLGGLHAPARQAHP